MEALEQWYGLDRTRRGISLSGYRVTLAQRVADSHSGSSLQDLRLSARILSEVELDTTWVSRYPVEQG